MLVYVCSPLKAYAYNTVYHNTEQAKKYCRHIATTTPYTPIAPHIYCTEFLQDDIPEERELGMKIGIELLAKCREIWVFGDYISEGMAKEIEYAQKNRITIKFFDENCNRRNEDEQNRTQTTYDPQKAEE